jgi:hypothetical protein
MRANLFVFALSASIAFGQDQSRVFHLHHIESEQDLKEFATMVRLVAELPQVKADSAQKTLAVQGPASQIAIAEFLFTELDRQTVPDSVSQEFRPSRGSDDVVRLLFVPHAKTVADFQQITTSVRLVTEMQRVFTLNRSRALAVRGTADQVAGAEFLVQELDQPDDAKRTDSSIHQMIDPRKMGFTAVQVFYLPYTSTIKQFQEVATLTRNIGEIRQVFTYNSPRALIVRGTPDQVALADWMVHELAKPVAAEASQKYQYPDIYRDHENIVRVFYVKDAATVAAFQQLATEIRTATKIRRVFTYNESMALAVRGTEAQIAMAEQMLHDRQIAAK